MQTADDGVRECPQCGGESYRLGSLGGRGKAVVLVWWRCEDCGWDHTSYAEVEAPE